VNIRFDFGTYDSVIKNNTVRNGVDNILIAGDSSNIFIEYNLVSGGKDSIYLFGANDNIVRHNNVYDSTYGIRLYKSTGNIITQNYLHDNQENLYPSDAGSTVSDNANRANYYGDENPGVTPTPGSTVVDATAVPGPGTGEGQTDILSWLWGIISSLFAQ
jgi:parallel beta-helix repeat protein